jgi:3-deoxy-D-manno-octulosonic-acid transferase
MRWLYILLAYLLAPLFCVVLLWRGFRERGYWRNFSERLGFGKALNTRSLWVHGASMGEVQAAAALVRSLRERHPEIPVVLTTVTATGRDRVHALFGEQVQARFLPLDLPGSVRRFFYRVKPRVAVIFETEIWPNLYHECARRRVPLVLASARLSTRSVSRYRRMAGLFKTILSQDVMIAAQGESDAERFRSIGADPKKTHVTGNIKFDLELPPDVVARGKALRDQHAANRKVWIAGSTHAGEEEIILEAHRCLRQTTPDALLILVPRHPSRFGEVADWLTREGVRHVRRSQGGASDATTEVLLVDTLGELLSFYAASDVAFVGGSLVPIGGHNLLEPAALGLPVLTGPHCFNGSDVARLLIERGAAEVIHDASELNRKLSALLADEGARQRIGALGRASIEDNRGALKNLLSLIEPLLSR